MKYETKAKLFVEFLVKQGASRKQFENNCGTTIEQYISLNRDDTPKYIVRSSFGWIDTPEDHTFWSKIYDTCLPSWEKLAEYVEKQETEPTKKELFEKAVMPLMLDDVIVKCTRILNIYVDHNSKLSILLRDVDVYSILESIDLQELIDYIGEDKVKDYYGIGER